MSSETTFILADNQDVTRTGLHGYLSHTFGTCRIVDVSNKSELVLALLETPDSVVILDFNLFNMNDLTELLKLEQRFPGAYWILFSNELSEELIRTLSPQKSMGMILKENSGEEIRSALICAVHKERFLCHQVSNRLIAPTRKSPICSPLTATEIEILKLIAHGKSVKEIAAERMSSVHTIVTHKKNIFRKLGTNSVYEATKYALRAGLVELVEYYI